MALRQLDTYELESLLEEEKIQRADVACNSITLTLTNNKTLILEAENIEPTIPLIGIVSYIKC